jgi:hypothetical protein
MDFYKKLPQASKDEIRDALIELVEEVAFPLPFGYSMTIRNIRENVEVLCHSPLGYYSFGFKNAGQNPTFLLRIGWFFFELRDSFKCKPTLIFCFSNLSVTLDFCAIFEWMKENDANVLPV